MNYTYGNSNWVRRLRGKSPLLHQCKRNILWLDVVEKSTIKQSYFCYISANVFILFFRRQLITHSISKETTWSDKWETLQYLRGPKYELQKIKFSFSRLLILSPLKSLHNLNYNNRLLRSFRPVVKRKFRKLSATDIRRATACHN